MRRFPDLCHRFRTCGDRRCAVLFRVSDADTVHRFHAGYQSIYGCCFRRNRIDPGALIGGILLGIIEILGRAYISSQLSDAIVFAVLIVVLLVKPTGILGKQIHEKV